MVISHLCALRKYFCQIVIRSIISKFWIEIIVPHIQKGFILVSWEECWEWENQIQNKIEDGEKVQESFKIFVQVNSRLMEFLNGRLLVLVLKECLVECATVCVKSVVILKSLCLIFLWIECISASFLTWPCNAFVKRTRKQASSSHFVPCMSNCNNETESEKVWKLWMTFFQFVIQKSGQNEIQKTSMTAAGFEPAPFRTGA